MTEIISCLVVDDSEVVREITMRIIAELNLKSAGAGDAADAIEACALNKPKVVFLDWDLPSMGALDFLRGVAEMEASERPEIVLCATENDLQQFTLAKAAGAGHHILKPFDKALITAKLVEIGLLEGAALGAQQSA